MSLVLTRRHNVDRFGYLIPTWYGNVPMVGAVATYRPGEGRFGGAVAVEEATTNLLKDVADFNTSSWSRRNVDVTLLEYNGMPGARFTPTGAGIAAVDQTFLSSGAAGRTFTWSFYARGQTARTFQVNFYGGVDGTFQSYVIQLTTEWRRYSITHTFPATATSGRIQWGNVSPYWGIDYLDWIEVAGVQVEEKPFATSFVDGTRAMGKLMYPGAIPSNEGTLLIWAKKNTLEPNTRDGHRKILDAQLPRIDFQWNRLGNLSADFGGASLSIPDPAQDLYWHQYAITYSGRTVKMYFDGQLVASGQAQEDLVNFSELCVGVRWDGVGAGNALYDELLILPYAASEEEIRAWYEADGPLPLHPQATLQWDWQAVRPATMVAL